MKNGGATPTNANGAMKYWEPASLSSTATIVDVTNMKLQTQTEKSLTRKSKKSESDL